MAALLMIDSGLATDLIGITLIATSWMLQKFIFKKEATVSLTSKT